MKKCDLTQEELKDVAEDLKKPNLQNKTIKQTQNNKKQSNSDEEM